MSVIWCDVCDDYYSDSRIDVLKHLKEDHTLSERLENSLYEGTEPEDTYA